LTVFLTLFFSCRTQSREWELRLTAGQGVFSLSTPYFAIRSINTEVYVEGTDQKLRLANLNDLVVASSPFTDELGSGTETTISGKNADGHALQVSIKDYGGNFVVAEARLTNNASLPFTIEGFSFAVNGSSSSRIISADIQGVLNNGYQSWSPSIFSKIVDNPRTDEALFEDVENDGDTILLDMRTSWWYSAIHTAPATLISGSLTANRWKTKVLTYKKNKGMIWKVITGHTWVQERPARERITLEPGEKATSERVFIGIYQDPLEGLEEYARSVALLNPPPNPPFVPIGWNSWNTFFSDINENKILANAQFIKDHFPEHGFNNIQIDDGWENYLGDWTTDTTRFPSGMDGLAQSITAMGFTPGIWMAPFLVDKNAPIFLQKQNEGWFLRDQDGQFLTNGPDTYIIDTTHPDAKIWVLAQIKQALGWGYRYLKLDFLFAETYEGKRYRTGATSMEAYKEIMEAIVEEAKTAGAYVLACGAPILPTAGLAHGIRTGADIALGGLPYYWPFIKNESLNTANRYFLNILFASDPDTALLWSVPLEEARVNLTAALLSGKIFALGDALPSLSPDKLALIEKIKDFPVFQGIKDPSHQPIIARPKDLFSSPSSPQRSVPELLASPSKYEVPEVWVLKASEDSAVVGLFNWSEDTHSVGVSLSEAGLKGNSYQALELWSGNDLGAISSSVNILQPPHSVSLVWLH